MLPLSLALLAILIGCKSKPESSANPLIGDWTSTSPASSPGCPAHYHFTDTTQTLTTAGRDITMQVGYRVQPDLVTVVMQMGTNSFKFLTPDSVAWTTGPCTYKRD